MCQWVNPEDLLELEPKNDLHPKQAMLSICWNFQGIVYQKLLPHNTTINAKLYWQQLEKLKTVLQVNRPERRKVRLLHDNARSHTVKFICPRAGRIRAGGLTPSIIFPRSGSPQLSSTSFAPQSSDHKTLR